MSDCLFCKILNGDIPSTKVFEDEKIYVFKDIHPKADVHLLVIPRVHIARLDETGPEHADLLAHMMLSLPQIAKAQGLDDGFRSIINTGPGGGQEVDHLHIHILGGSSLPGFK
ncbi:histidine triad nucleotide-binding protein [Methylophaga sp.]|jgi:histidine triad (HIT) family protein|uniref:histidine triad nucleotide-binding protein n=1 Tax=Methylophaga sp. TaxID=2024840 RepID=UPI0013FE6B15|nr:histidine triad nucleotide-binding protein [Methylophaga sp.]MTI63001.1 histidine triad nucleotide-binding protein [Methylophaga sp.]